MEEKIKDEEMEETLPEGETQTPSEPVENEQQPQVDEAQPVVNDNIEEEQPVDDEAQPEPEQELAPEPEPTMFSQEQVNELVGKTRMEARDKAMRALFDRYGVDTEDEMNDIFGRGQAYDVLNDNYNTMNGEMASLKAENALLKSKIDPSRWDDAKLILTGKGMEVTEETIASELVTHPEWMGAAAADVQQQPEAPTQELTLEMAKEAANTPTQNISNNPQKQQPSTIRKFGSSVPETENSNEDSVVNRLFGLN